MAERRLFGTDGVRGVANLEPMTSATVMRLGMAVAARLKQPGRHTRIVIGKDTRLSGYMFETAMASGIVAMGADVWITGPLPTPGIAFITSSMRCDAGVVISASHNPFEDNGIKLFARDGFKLPDAVEAEIEALMASPDLEDRRADAVTSAVGAVDHDRQAVEGEIGRERGLAVHDVAPARVLDLAAVADVARAGALALEPGRLHQRLDLGLDGLTIVVDGAHGAGYRVGPAVFEELGAKVIAINCAPNGKNINDHAGALSPEAMCAAVRQHGAHVGIALDGDADRLVLCDERGEVVDGDAVMALCATRMLGEGRLAKGTLVTTVMSNLGLERAIKTAGGKVVRTQVGDRYVVEEMRKHGYNLGGEQSGHLVFLDHATTGDGIIAALRVLAIMVREGRPLSELATVMTRTPQVLINVKVDRKRPLEELAAGGELAVTHPAPPRPRESALAPAKCAIVAPPRFALVRPGVLPLAPRLCMFARPGLGDWLRLFEVWRLDERVDGPDPDAGLAQLAERTVLDWEREGARDIRPSARWVDDGRRALEQQVEFTTSGSATLGLCRWFIDADGVVFRIGASGDAGTTLDVLRAEVVAAMATWRRLDRVEPAPPPPPRPWWKRW